MVKLLARDSRGQELVEYALTLPILLLLVIGIMEFGVAIFAYNTVSNAAREGARVGAVVPIPDEDDLEDAKEAIKDAVVARTGGLALSGEDNINVVITFAETDQGDDTVAVTVTYMHPMITGLILRPIGGKAELELNSVATMRREAPLSAGGS